jgi:hypothetical protein
VQIDQRIIPVFFNVIIVPRQLGIGIDNVLLLFR